LTVVDALPGSAAAKAGLSTNDVIESVNNIATRDMPLAFAEILLQGEPGSSIEMSVLTPRQADPQKIKLVRAPLVTPAVSAKLVTDQGPDPIGLISTSSLQAGRAREIGQKITEGIAVANLFMDKGLITYSLGQKSTRQDHNATSSKAITKLPLVVLVNRGTAGAAEVAAGALLDSKRAELVGEPTYGDAAIRKAITMDDGSAVILSVAKFYTPSGKAIQDVHVTPTVLQADTTAVVEPDDDPANPGNAQPAQPAKPGEDEILKHGFESLRQLK
jgi:carboxyl-terminal processing protease